MKKISIGRDPENTFCVPERTVSRRHAEIHFGNDDSIHIKDLGSTHGTFLCRPEGEERISIANLSLMDRIRFGQVEMFVVEEIVDDILTKTQMPSHKAQNLDISDASVTRVRCHHCKSIIVKQWSDCPFCGERI